MTNEQAIDLLDNLIGFVEDSHESDYDEALKMAIEALQQGCEKVAESCDDYITIKRQFVQDAIAIGLSGYITDDDKLTLEGMGIAVSELPSAQPEIVRCKDCKHFEYDHVENVDGIPLIVAHEICTRWSDGVKTSENGYCFLGERGEADDE